MLKFLQQQQQQQQPQTQQSIGVHPAAANDDSAQHVVRDFWETVGREQPWWGVLTQPLYSGQGELEPAAKEAFFATGSAEVAFIDDVLRTHGGLGGGLSALQDGAFLDFGCGVGRIALHMARHCTHVMCVDVADAYLRHLAATCEAHGVCNYSAVPLDSFLAEGVPLADVSLVYSLLTLQHNPPALILRLVGALCAVLRPGGFGVLHVPYAFPEGHRSVRPNAPVMQMHCVPKAELVECVERAGCALVRIVDVDRCGGGIDNCVYIVRRPSSPAAQVLFPDDGSTVAPV